MQQCSPLSGAPVAIEEPLSGAALLAAWENGAGESPPIRALAVLRAACPALRVEDAITLPLKLRDQAFIALHALTFGTTFSARATCGACGEQLEFALPAQQIAASLQAADAECTLTRDGIRLYLRLANTRDVMDAAAVPDLDAARHLLVTRCAQAVDSDGQVVPVPDALRDVALDRLDVMHDAAEIALTLDCPGCHSRQAVSFDVATFLWAEIRHAALRLLDEIHELAWAYGWSERAILAMSATRRQAYLERVRG
jgi:hypothetical protein